MLHGMTGGMLERYPNLSKILTSCLKLLWFVSLFDVKTLVPSVKYKQYLRRVRQEPLLNCDARKSEFNRTYIHKAGEGSPEWDPKLPQTLGRQKEKLSWGVEGLLKCFDQVTLSCRSLPTSDSLFIHSISIHVSCIYRTPSVFRQFVRHLVSTPTELVV